MNDSYSRSLIESLIRPYIGIPDYAIAQMAEAGVSIPGYVALNANHALAVQSARAFLKASPLSQDEERSADALPDGNAPA